MKIDKKTIVIILLVVIIIGIGSVYAYNTLMDKSYNQGIDDAVIMINQQLLDNLNQNGYIPYIYPINETSSIQIKLVPQLEQKRLKEEI